MSENYISLKSGFKKSLPTIVNASILKYNIVFKSMAIKYRLIVENNYIRQWVFIRYIGTHGDYDNVDANKI